MDRQKVNKALRILAGEATVRIGGKVNAEIIERQLQVTCAQNPLRLWQFVCPPKTTLGPNGWIVDDDAKYDVFGPSIAKTKSILAELDRLGVVYTMTIYYPDDEILKARASGLKLETMETDRKNDLLEELAELSLARSIKLQEEAGQSIEIVMWSEVASRYDVEIDQLFVEELEFWKTQGARGTGYFAETQKWLTQTFGFKPELAKELTARRIAKYAVEGKVISRVYPTGSIYLNNEYPFREPWSMYTAAVNTEERKRMAVSYYMCK